MSWRRDGYALTRADGAHVSPLRESEGGHDIRFFAVRANGEILKSRGVVRRFPTSHAGKLAIEAADAEEERQRESRDFRLRRWLYDYPLQILKRPMIYNSGI